MKRRTNRIGMLLAAAIVLVAEPAMAYLGPGSGLMAIIVFLGVLAGLIVAIIGFIWYPLRRLKRRWQHRQQDHQHDADDE